MFLSITDLKNSPKNSAVDIVEFPFIERLLDEETDTTSSGHVLHEGRSTEEGYCYVVHRHHRPRRPTARVTGRGRVARVGLATVVAATAANTLIYFAAGTLVSYDPRFLPLANVSGAIVFTLPAAIVAVLVYAALLRFARKPGTHLHDHLRRRLRRRDDPGLHVHPDGTGRTVAQTAILVLMHIVAAAVIVRMLTALARPQAR